MKILEGLFWLGIGVGFGFMIPIGIEQLIQDFSPREVADPNRAFLFYFLIAIASGITAGRTLLWVHLNKDDNRISAVLGFFAGFVSLASMGFIYHGSETYVMAAGIALTAGIISGVINALKASSIERA